jgi:hypothetical protein
MKQERQFQVKFVGFIAVFLTFLSNIGFLVLAIFVSFDDGLCSF